MERPIPYLSLTDVVNEYMLASMNDRRKYFINYLSHAKWIWKSLIWKTIWAVKNKYVDIDTTTTPHSIVIPKDMVRFLSLSEEDDCSNLRSLSFKEDMNVLPKTVAGNCCAKCGEPDPLGQCVSNLSLVTKTVVIDDVPYTEKLWKKLCANGDLVEIREFPSKSYNSADAEDGFEIVFTTLEKYICKFEKKPCGCLVNNEKNKEMIVTHCGCLTNTCQKDLCETTLSGPPIKHGVLKIENGRIYVKYNKGAKLILSYQTNGECAESEIMVPEIAVDAMIFGIDFRSKALAPNADRFEKRESERMWNKAKSELEEFLNPIIVSEFMNLQMSIPKWGHSPNGDNFNPYSYQAHASKLIE